MKRNIPSRLCDRCGKVYKLADTSRVKGHAFKATLDWEPPDGGELVHMTVDLPDLCPECKDTVVAVLRELLPRKLVEDESPAAAPAEGEGT